MKETIQLSLGGYAFTFEKDAADTLEGYLKTLETHYLKQEGGKEIMEGIEEPWQNCCRKRRSAAPW